MFFWTGIYLCSIVVSVYIFGILVTLSFVINLLMNGNSLEETIEKLDEKFGDKPDDEFSTNEISKRIMLALILSGLSMIALSLVFNL